MNQNKLIETSFQIYFFFQVFKKYIEIPDFTPMDLEMAIFGKVLATDYQMEDKKKEQEKGSDDNPATDWIENRELQDSLLEQLIEALLPLISPQKKYNYQTWPYMLKKAIDLNLHDFYQNENPLKVTYSMKFDNIQRNEHPFYILPSSDKLQILNYLCMWSLSEGQIKQAINEAATKKEASNKNKIWHVGQTARLYFQNKTKWSIISSTIEELELYAEHLWPIGPEGFLKAHINTNIIIPLKEKREKDLLEKKLEKERQEKREEMKRLKLERLRKRGELNLSYEMGTRKRSKQTNFKAYFASESESEDDYVPRRKVIEMSDSENDKENESDNMDPLLA
ncbi:hypothetical protein HK103_005584 [Boothiomyces macroporosus]|uniref:WHIM1 domain-containing protein n=1 Tax=Boothiomyces macroporosus TaxID=261099 RepID=A0AAD5Y580_9FUNG|nr:hypothetical protein HK103_005584 [Boothiomyces macroporosus]